MKTRSPIVVVLLTFITFGIYGLIWHISTKDEMNAAYGTKIPTGWLLILPILNLYWLWKWSEGAEKATGMSGVSVFLLMIVIPIVGIPVMVSKFNSAKPGVAMPMLRRAA